MAKRQSQRKSRGPARRYFEDFDPEKGRVNNLPPNLGRGASIRLVTADGTVVDHSPWAYKRLSRPDRRQLVGSICNALGIPQTQAA